MSFFIPNYFVFNYIKVSTYVFQKSSITSTKCHGNQFGIHFCLWKKNCERDVNADLVTFKIKQSRLKMSWDQKKSIKILKIVVAPCATRNHSSGQRYIIFHTRSVIMRAWLSAKRALDLHSVARCSPERTIAPSRSPFAIFHKKRTFTIEKKTFCLQFFVTIFFHTNLI